jgi:hypothetical protein
MTATAPRVAEFDVAASPDVPRSRIIKFTPERFEQIRNLVERGMSREDIADTIGVTVGSLQVTCSRVGISLRRPKGVPRLYVPKPAPTATGNGTTHAVLTLSLSCREQQCSFPVPVDGDMLTAMALAAERKGMRLTEYVGRLLAHAIEKEVSK